MGGQGSGRHRRSLEKIRVETLEKAWQITHAFLHDEKIDLNYRLQFAIDIVKKNVPQEIKGQGFGDTKIIILQRKEDSARKIFNGELSG